MSDQTSQAALVANVNVEQVKQALADIKAALGEMSSAARGASDALGSLNNVPLTGAIEHVRALNLEIERTVQLAGAARGGLAGLGGGVSDGAGGGGEAMAVGLGGESASLSGPKGAMLAADIMATPEQRLSNARVVMANAKAEGILTTGERNAVSEGLNRYGTSIFGEMTWAADSVGKLKAFAAERGALLAAAPVGLLAGMDPAIAHHLGMAGGGNPLLAALGAGGTILGSMVFGRGAGEDETLFGSMFPGIPGPSSARQGYLTRMRNNITGRYTGGIDYDNAPLQGPLLGQFMPPEDIIKGNADFVRQSRIEQRAIDASTRSDTRSRTEAARADAAAMAEARREAGAITAEERAAARQEAALGKSLRYERSMNDELIGHGKKVARGAADLTRSIDDVIGTMDDAAEGPELQSASWWQKRQTQEDARAARHGRAINQHSPGGAFLYGLAVVPGFMAANAVFGAGMSALQDIGDSQTANEQMAFALGVSPDSSTVSALRNSATNIGAPLGYKSADMVRTATENYRLTHNLPDTTAMTKASATISRMAGTDPATVQDELAALYKSFGAKAAGRFPDVMAGIIKNFDVNPASFEQSMARMAPIASSVGIGAGEQGMETLAAWTAALMQDADLSPATTQSALRMFASNIRNPSKIKAMKKAGFGDISQMDMGGVLEKLQGIDQQDHGKALQLLELLSGNKSGLYAEDLLKNADKIAEAFKKIAGVAPGTADAYAARLASQTLPGQLEQLSADWARLWNNPNSLPARAAGGSLNVLDGALRGLSDAGSLGAFEDALRRIPSVAAADKRGGLDALLNLNRSQADIAMVKEMERELRDPRTSSPALLTAYNDAMGAIGKGPFMLQPKGNKIPTTHEGPFDLRTLRGQALELSGRTGIPAGVMLAWMTQEGARPSLHNPMNIMYVGQKGAHPSNVHTTDGTVAQWDDPVKGLAATAALINSPTYQSIRDAAALGKSPDEIMRAIGQSPWDAGHYQETGGGPGQALINVYKSRGLSALDTAPKAKSRAAHMTRNQALDLLFGTHETTWERGKNPQETGLDITMPSKNNLKLPFGGRFVASASTRYQSVFRMDDGHFESFTHIDPIGSSAHGYTPPWKDGQYLAAGTSIGHTHEGPGPYWGRSLAPFDKQGDVYNSGLPTAVPSVAYRSDGTHLEFGVYTSARGAGTFDAKSSLDPVSYVLAAAKKSLLESGGGTGSYAIVPANTPAQANTIGAASGANVNDQLQAIINNTALANGYLNRMANFNVPSDYMIPTYEGWAAYRGPATSPKATAPHHAGSARHATHNAGTGMGGGGGGVKGGARLQ